MTKTLNKNILEVTVGLICHQTNCFGAFGGLAGAIGAKWPIVKKEYSDTILQNNERWKLLGEYQS
jgi:O-acetyl-ADP-ribose deacetylase (regulator of RNase III)